MTLLGFHECQVPTSTSDEALINVHGMRWLQAEHAAPIPSRFVGDQVAGELHCVGIWRCDLDCQPVRPLGGGGVRTEANVARR